MKNIIIVVLLFPTFIFAQDPDVGGSLFYSDIDGSSSPFSRNERICFDLDLGSSSGLLHWPPPTNLPFEANISTVNLVDRTVEFLENDDPYLDENFFDVTVPADGSQINLSQNSAIPAENYSQFKVCGVIPSTVEDGSTVQFNVNGDPGGYSQTNVGDDNFSNIVEVQGTLPIELLHFQANAGENQVALDWSTATELNNSHFEIQRSADGRQFQQIGHVAGHGTTSEVISYSFLDDNPLHGKSYYRLKQVDFDGFFQFSPVEQVELEGNDHLTIYPNPAESGTEITIQGKQIRQIQVYDMLGKLFLHQEFEKPSDQVNLSSSQLPKGMYITRINNTSEKRLVIN